MPNYGNERLTMFPPVIKWLLGINVAVFVMEMVTFGGNIQGIFHPFELYGALWPIGTSRFGLWQYVTYMFLHGGVSHIFFNMLTLWMFGMELEQMWGSRRFLAYYLLCGLGAGVIHSIVTMVMGTGAPTLGASGAIMGVMVAFGLVFPDRVVFMGFFFPMRARFAVLLFAGIDLYLGVVGSTDGVAHFAHLGGALVGVILLKTGGKMTLGGIFDKLPGFGPRRSTIGIMSRPQNPARGSARVVDVSWRDVEPARQEQRRSELPTMNFGDEQEAVDRILDKITREGYQNLTAEEKALLTRVSKGMR